MKIFNWVHRKLSCGNNIDPSATYEGIDEIYHDQTSKAMTDNVVADKQVLLPQGALVEVLGSWNNAMLTIGTLGSFDDSLNYCNFNYDEIDEVVEGEEENHEERKADYEEEDENYPLVVRSLGEILKHEIDMTGFQTNPIVVVEKNDGKKNGERTTLADLFSADYDNDIDNDFRSDASDHSGEVLPKFKALLAYVDLKKHALGGTKNTKNGKFFAKKLIPRVGDDSRPIKKLNHLMTRMLKRKIHPVFDGKIPKSDGQCGILNNVELEANENAFLLQI